MSHKDDASLRPTSTHAPTQAGHISIEAGGSCHKRGNMHSNDKLCMYCEPGDGVALSDCVRARASWLLLQQITMDVHGGKN
jgi:hypothetical protein